MGLFSKKTCDICGANMGRITDCKIKDGGICKECKKKLSPWFSGAGRTSLEEIRMQMEDREANRRRLEDFTTAYAFGEVGCILIDEKHQQFVALETTSETAFGSAKIVTSLEEIKDRNPDIIKFSQIEEVKIDEVLNSKEEMHTADGRQVSYDPKHMTYMASFTIRIRLNHPYIEQVYIPLCHSIHIKCEEPRKMSTLGEKTAAWLLDRPEARIEKMEKVYDHNSFFDMLYRSPYEMPSYSFGFKCSIHNEKEIQRYRAFLLMANQIKEILTEGAKQEIDWNQDLLTIIREHTDFQVLEKDKQVLSFVAALYAEKYLEKPFFPVIAGCGGIVIDGWIRLYGAGELSIVERNREIELIYDSKHPKEMEIILGEDILGGLYGMKDDIMYFFDPGTARWRCLSRSYEEFVKWLVTSPDEIRQFYDDYRWSSWKEDAKALSLDEGYTIMPRLFKDSETPADVRYREKVRISQVIGMLYLEM